MARADGAGGGQPIRYPSILSTLGADYQQQWADSTHDEIKRVQGSIAQPRHFGEIPAAQQFAAVYQAAVHVYEATLKGIKTDLEAAGEALARAGQEIRARDEVSADAFQQLRSQWSTEGGFTSTQQHEAASQHQQVRDGVQAKVTLEQAAARAEQGGAADDAQAGPDDAADGGMDTGGETPAHG
ncbi:hypothetical protein [uncultured Phycicoccus sp.]|uniref:hypothetical protein n=1 Tax=uncultured Phycicoccus sp. TaxID=661422 RepID=UPI00261E92A7|nr:hypothetical protein [uncultured Phycicoccus sp.]